MTTLTHDADRGVYRTRPHTPSDPQALDALVEVRATWGDDAPLAVAHLDAGERFVLTARGASGDDPRRFVHPSVERGAHALVDHRGPSCVIALPRGASATLTSCVGSWTVTADDAAAAVPLDAGVQARITWGDVRFDVRRVPATERLPPPRRSRLLGVAAPVAFACTVLLGAWTQRRDPGDDYLARDTETREAWLRAHGEALLRARAYVPDHALGAGVEGGTGLRAPGMEGATGLMSSRPVARRWVLAPSRRATGETAPVRLPTGTPVQVRALAGLDALGMHGATGLIPSVFQRMGTGDVDRQSGAMYGEDTGVARGFEGLGLSGAGWGGGRGGDGLVGLGRIATRGHGVDDGDGQGYGPGQSACGCGDSGTYGGGVGRGLGLRAGRTVCTLPAQVAVHSLDAGEIRRVVRENLGQVRRCHELAMVGRGRVEGRIAVRWSIDGAGAVTEAVVTDDGTGVPSLGQCVADATRRWRFTRDDQGATTSVVVVNYPFTLTVADE